MQTRSFNESSKPYVRWWWLAGPFRQVDILQQLAWAKSHGFGGVEVAWVRPVWDSAAARRTPTPKWLSPEWSELIAFTKSTADQLGLGCDFTFGTSWP
ncbi:MAG: glycosyl hydrolase, partial [Maioricimonas sp. JB049]